VVTTAAAAAAAAAAETRAEMGHRQMKACYRPHDAVHMQLAQLVAACWRAGWP
jgi:hypothetical protein